MSARTAFIKKGVDCTLVEDITSYAESTLGDANLEYFGREAFAASVTVASTTDTYDANSLTVAVGSMYGNKYNGTWKLRLYMDGVLEAELDVPQEDVIGYGHMLTVVATRALSGSTTCYIQLFESAAGNAYICCSKNDVTLEAAGVIGVGSVKV